MKSIIQDEDECFICRMIYKVETPATETHHVIYGRGMRELADRDGLTVRLCNLHHDRLHRKHEFDKALQIIGQRKYIEKLMSDGMSEEEAKANFLSRYSFFRDWKENDETQI